MTDLRRITNLRLEEARLLLRASRPSGAYYLAGYSLECALKACIASNFRKFQMPPKKVVIDAHTHKLEDLVTVAGIKGALDAEIATNSDFATNWGTAKDWQVESRYIEWSMQEARDLISAIATTKSGVLRWIKQFW